jgi:hypothetical protein
VTLAVAAAGFAVLQYRLVSNLPPTVLYISLAAIPLATYVLSISYRMLAGGGACCLLARLEGGGGSTVAAAAVDHPPLLAPGSWGVGIQGRTAGGGWPVPHHTAPLLVTQGGGGGER